jgi:hypothetical protein
MNGVILNLKIVRFNVRPANMVEVRSLDINNAPAIQTDQVMVLVELGVKARRRARVAGPGHEPEGSERREDTMHCHAGNLRKFAANFTIKLLSGRVIRAVQDCFKDSAPLGSNRQPGFAVCREKALDSFLFFGTTHRPEMSLCTG